MPRKTAEQRLAYYEEQIRKLRAQASKQKRARETHAKIVFGGELLSALGLSWEQLDPQALRNMCVFHKDELLRELQPADEDTDVSWQRLKDFEKKRNNENKQNKKREQA